MPDGFPSLSQLRTDKFDYNINKNRVTVTADLEDPVNLLGEGMTVHDVQMTFKYDKNRPGGKWRFNAEGGLIIKCQKGKTCTFGLRIVPFPALGTR